MRRNPFCFLMALSLLPATIFSQTFKTPISAAYLGLSAYSTQYSDVFSFVNNQAALAQAQHTAIGVYSERRFALAEVNEYTIAAIIPTNKGNFGVSLQYDGFVNYNENQIGIAYGKSLGKKIDVGIQFNYYRYMVRGYGSNSTVNAEIGAIAHLTDKLNAGIHIYNPVGGRFFKGDEKLTPIIKTGFGYDASERFYVSAEFEKEENFSPGVNAGAQYQFQKRFFARAGIVSGTSSYYAGAGVAWSNLRLDISCSMHPQLGLSPGLLLIMDFNKKKQ
jgi:hypothetical protein